MLAQHLDIGHEVRRRVLRQTAQRTRPPGAALIEDHHAPEARIEEPAVHGTRSGAGSAMKEQHRLSAGRAHLLPIHDMTAGQRHVAGLERADLGK